LVTAGRSGEPLASAVGRVCNPSGKRDGLQTRPTEERRVANPSYSGRETGCKPVLLGKKDGLQTRPTSGARGAGAADRLQSLNSVSSIFSDSFSSVVVTSMVFFPSSVTTIRVGRLSPCISL